MLDKHLAAENSFVDSAAQFFHQKAALDADYAKSLTKLIKGFTSASKDEYG